MATIGKAEAGVLKLVRPGRRVELHTVPVTAAEVMRRYPRHSITRPDIFEYPWIVVKPEAVLVPGRVFYIVPNRTIYQLLKAKESSDSDQSSSLAQQQQRESPKDQAQQQVTKKTSPSNKTDAGRTPKHQEHRKRLKHQFLNMSCATTTVCPTPTEEQDHEKEVQRAVLRLSTPVTLASKTAEGESKRKSSSPSSKNEKRKGKGKAGVSSITGKLADLKFITSKQVRTPKSCIRKPDSARKLRQFIVKFDLPDDYVERQTKAADNRIQYPDYSIDDS